MSVVGGGRTKEGKLKREILRELKGWGQSPMAKEKKEK